MLETTQSNRSNSFWNTSPCGGFASFEERAAVRYARDPWLPAVLKKVSGFKQIVEVGCGQGTDALTVCKMLAPGADYRGFDPSEESVASAEGAREQVSNIAVMPEFTRANALSLPVADGSSDCVYSCGVIHHIDNTEGALAEIRRILGPNGKAFIAIYRTASPKVAGAHVLRGIQTAIDKITRRERTVLRFLEKMGWDMPDGTTMVRECFGVPILKSYTRSGVENLFRDFSIDAIEPHGYLWMISATKSP